MLVRIDNMGAPDVGNVHPGSTNVVGNMSRISAGKVDYAILLTKYGWTWILEPEKKRVKLIKDMVQSFFKPGGLIFAMFERTLSTVKTRPLLDNVR